MLFKYSGKYVNIYFNMKITFLVQFFKFYIYRLLPASPQLPTLRFPFLFFISVLQILYLSSVSNLFLPSPQPPIFLHLPFLFQFFKFYIYLLLPASPQPPAPNPPILFPFLFLFQFFKFYIYLLFLSCSSPPPTSYFPSFSISISILQILYLSSVSILPPPSNPPIFFHFLFLVQFSNSLYTFCF